LGDWRWRLRLLLGQIQLASLPQHGLRLTIQTEAWVMHILAETAACRKGKQTHADGNTQRVQGAETRIATPRRIKEGPYFYLGNYHGHS
jgi:hypothetical protein